MQRPGTPWHSIFLATRAQVAATRNDLQNYYPERWKNQKDIRAGWVRCSKGKEGLIFFKKEAKTFAP
jgi:hypothetical protein